MDNGSTATLSLYPACLINEHYEHFNTIRELAMQSHQVVLDVGGLKSVCIYGGVPKPQQKADLRAGAEVSREKKKWR